MLLEAALREIIKDVVRAEVRAALHDERVKTARRRAESGRGPFRHNGSRVLADISASQPKPGVGR